MGDTESQPLTGKRDGFVYFTVLILIIGSIAALSVTTAVLSHSTQATGTCSANYHPNYAPVNLADPSLQPKGNLLIKSCTLYTGTNVPGENPIEGLTDILIENGKITNVAPGIANPNGYPVLDAAGGHCTPGVVDMHSHFGGSSIPTDTFGNSDTNEATRPAVPFVRARDGIDPYDPAIDLIRGGGVTTSVILPGSADVMGGEAVIVKLRPAADGPMGVKKNSVAALQIPDSPRVLKFACGENPKRVFGSRDELPGSRMGIAYTFRQRFDQAKRAAAQLAEWECQPDDSKSNVAPESMDYEPLIALLDGNALAFVHCYKVTDMLSVIEIAKEYGWKISSFHHAIEAWLIADVLAQENITVATFAQHGLFKMEGYRQNPAAGAIIANAGANLAYKSDHPVLFARELYRQAGIAIHHGLPVTHAIPSITSVPAAAMGMSDRIGRVAVGLDGDVVIWNTYPLSAYAKAKTVVLEGLITDNRQDLDTTVPNPTTPTGTCDVCNSCPKGSIYALTNIGKLYTLTDDVNSTIADATIIIQNGVVSCAGAAADCPPPVGSIIYTFGGNTAATPGWIAGGVDIGNMEVHAESNSWDGNTPATPSAEEFVAADGAAPHLYQGKHTSLALGTGILSTILNPQSLGVVQGIASYLHTIGDLLPSDGLIAERIGLVVTVGNRAKSSGDFLSITGQINYLRGKLSAPTGVWSGIVNGSFPLIVRVHQRDAITALLRLHTTYSPQARFVLVGALEAHLLAPQLAAKSPLFSVLLTQWIPFSFDTFNSIENAYSVLKSAGVLVALAAPGENGDADQIPWFPFDAAQLVTQPGVTNLDALRAITRDVADVYQLGRFGVSGTVRSGDIGNVVVWSGEPLEYGSQVLVAVAGSNVACLPPFINLGF